MNWGGGAVFLDYDPRRKRPWRSTARSSVGVRLSCMCGTSAALRIWSVSWVIPVGRRRACGIATGSRSRGQGVPSTRGGAVCALHDGAEARRGGPLPDARAARERTMRRLGYPSKEVLAAWIDELAPGERHVRRGPGPRRLKRQGQPRNRDWAADALKAVFSMESRDKALENAEFVAKDMESRKLREAAKCLREGHRRDDDLPARRLSQGASPAHPHEQHDRTSQP